VLNFLRQVELLLKFFASAIPLLRSSTWLSSSSSSVAQPSSILVTLFEGEPYTLWNIRDLARHAGLCVARSFEFRAEAYPGYRHARTLGNIKGGGEGAWKGEERSARTYEFTLKE